ncbi:MAG: tRNA pseudouridine(13) synthase TruD [Thermoplasmata archaeon]|nr:tRNA pseudouridine(13) synthase TruD [Thermoplasmata archaeon]
MIPLYRECSTAEADIGMRRYLCDSDGTGGHLKTEPEDFVVREISDPPRRKDGGEYTIATVTSRNWETNRLVRILSRSIGMSRTRIGFAGTKDKRAVTTQLMSFRCPPEDVAKIQLKDVEIKDLYTGSRAIQLGDLIGNSFEITVRDLAMPMADVESIVRGDIGTIAKTGGFPNYFGVQRFGSVRPVTHLVGERLVRGDIEGAVRTYISYTTPEEEQDLRELRGSLEGCTDWAYAASVMPERMSFERVMAQALAGGEDWKGAISALPSNLQMMFVHAYQSYLFNEMLSERMARGLPLNAPVEGDVVIPLAADGTPQHENPIVANARNIDLVARQVRMGRAFVTAALYGSETVLAEGEPGEIEMRIAEENRLKPEDFVIPGLSKCSSKGGRREILCPVKDLTASFSDDSYSVAFSLPKGNYATCLMREFMKSEMRDY